MLFAAAAPPLSGRDEKPFCYRRHRRPSLGRRDSISLRSGLMRGQFVRINIFPGSGSRYLRRRTTHLGARCEVLESWNFRCSEECHSWSLGVK